MHVDALPARLVSIPPGWPRHICLWSGLYALFGGLTSFLGWAVDVRLLTDWVNSGISIQPNATVCVTASGAALLAYVTGHPRTGAVFGMLVGAIGALTLVQWLTGLSLGIDSLLMFGREWGRVGVVFPGRMGPPGSLSCTLLGVALVLSAASSPDLRKLAPRIALLTFGLSLLSIIGRLYGVDVLYAMPRLTVIALQTATFVAAVSVGIIALHPRHAPMRWLVSTTAVGIIARRAVPVILISPIGLGWLRLEGERAGLYEGAFGTALLALLLVVLLGVFTWRGLMMLSRHEGALLASEERMQLAITAGDAATWDTDLTTGTTIWSDSYFRLLGYDPAVHREATEALWKSAVLPDDLPAVLAEWRRAETAQDVYRAEYRLRHADGTIRWARAAGRFFYDPAGTAVRFVGVLFDVTDEKLALDALREADRRKDQFLATLAHELRNPLAPLRNAARLLQTKLPLVPELQSARDVIDRQVQHMARLIDDLLDMSRISRDQIVLQKERGQLSQILLDAVEASQPVIDQYGHQLTVTLPDERLVVDADKVRLAQVFCNLLNNAARYTPGGGSIELVAAAAGSEVVVTVRDNGIGIGADMLPRIFDMFVQADRSLRPSQGGLGIGLTLVKRLVELHGGRVEARSQGPGKGSEFIVHLPLAEDQAPVLPRQASYAAASIPASLHRILVVDDNEDAAESLAVLLQMMGNDIRVVYNGLDAVRVASEYRPDVVLLDIGLPGLDGHEVARVIRNEPWAARTTLIALTGWGQDEERRKSVDAGFDYHMVKPVEPDALMKLLASLAAKSGDPVAQS
jgi:PAS domain S-box-containing protein